MVTNQDLQNYLQPNMPHYLQLLREMVAINSFTANSSGVNKLGKLTAEAFSGMGFVAEYKQSANPFYGRHLILTRPADSRTSAPSIGLISHLDTVFPPDEERQNNFFWREEGDRIYGPGTVDIKGGTVVLYMVLKAIQASRPDLFESTNWMIFLNAAEEVLVPEFGEICRSRLPANTKACLVFEGGRKDDDGYSVVTARKGMATFRISVEGRAAHAGSAHGQGANAIVQLAELVANISKITDYERQLTINVGTIAGGTVINRVPHLALASGELRAFSSETLHESVSRLMALEDRSSVASMNGDYRCKINVNINDIWDPWPINESSNNLFRIWQQAGSRMGVQLQDERRGGLSDGNLVWNHVPTLDGLGPIGGNAHCSERSEDGSKDQEYLSVSTMIPKAVLSALSLQMLLEE